MSEAVLVVGTRKGLFVARSRDNRACWELSEPQFAMNAIYAIGIDTRAERPRIFASVMSEHWGASVVHSDDLGASWAEPARSPITFPGFTGASLERVWQIQPGTMAEPDVIYAGTQPSALFRSADGGAHFELVRALWDHPHRPHWAAGYGGQAIHTVVPHPADPDRLLVGMSTGGVYRTEDGGSSWAPANRGIRAPFLPDEYPEFGQCVHKIAPDATQPDRMYLQNHGGVYRSDDWGGQWTSIAADLPAEFGFPVLAHPGKPATVYVFPLVADAHRLPPEGRCRVYRSDDAGESWDALGKGLPERDFWVAVMRDALCADGGNPAGIYLGTRGGEVYASPDDGETWSQVAQHLPDVLCVRAVAVP
ncbi:MAG TPA: exo-alpha-sialidase [Streptosporangiaceae bacterium]|nr:exo-alpha-sialidase [Streptosporangiaceae bacterium]